MLALLLLCSSVQAAPVDLYLDAGVAKEWGITEDHSGYYWCHPHVIHGPYGTVELGARWHDVSLFAFHTSSITDQHDNGTIEVGIKYELRVRIGN